MKRVVLLVAIALAVAVTAGAIGYYYYNARQPQSSTNSTTQQKPAENSTTSPTDQTNGAASGNQSSGTPVTPSPGTSGMPSMTYPVNVYFSKHPDSDNDPARVFPVGRVSPTLGVGTYAISQLLAGPTAGEQQAGYFATARLRDGSATCTSDFTLSIQSGVATLQFCKTFDHIGVISDGQAESELKATLLQFSSIQKVIILNKAGDCEFNLSGLNLCKQ